MARKTSAEPVPATLERSPAKARATYAKTLESAEKTYAGDESAAHRAAWAAVKHGFEKVGDHWEAKAERGPSDARAAAGGPAAGGATYGGVDVAGKTKTALLAEARALGADVTTKMTKADVAAAIQKANRKADRAAR